MATRRREIATDAAGGSAWRDEEKPGGFVDWAAGAAEDVGGFAKDVFDQASGVSDFDPDVGFISGDPNLGYPGAARDVAMIDTARSGFYGDRGTENQLITDLQLAAAGQGPSVAEAQLQQGLDASQAQQMSMARSAQGGAAQRNAMLNQATFNAAQQAQETSREAGIQRAQEQIQARGELGGQLTSRQSNVLNQQQLALDQARANQDAQLAAERMRAEVAASNAAGKAGTTQGLLASAGGLLDKAATGIFSSDVRAKEDIMPMRSIAERAEEDRMRREQVMRELSGKAAASPFGDLGRDDIFSDVRAKEDIDSLDRAERRAMAFRDVEVDYPELSTPEGNRRGLGPMEPYRYRYTEDAADRIGADRGMRTGIMAQDMERSPYLQDAVVDTPNGKAIDEERALSGSLAAAAGLDKRLRGQEEETIDIEARIADLEQSLAGYDQAKSRGASEDELRHGRFGNDDLLRFGY